jgi:hypothetical protein
MNRGRIQPVPGRFFPWLVVSVALNALLLSALIKSWTRPIPAAESAKPAAIGEANSSLKGTPRVSSPADLPSARLLKAKWISLESDDPREYATRLRFAGCPETTVRVLIQAQLYKQRENRLAAIHPVPLYATAAEKRVGRIRIYKERQAITSEFDALLFELTGSRLLREPHKSVQEFLLAEALMQFMSSMRPGEAWQDVSPLLDRCEHAHDDLRELPPISQLHELSALADWYRRTIAQVIPPAKQREFAERLIAFLFVSDASETENFHFTAPELRALARNLVNDVPELQVPGLMVLLWGDPSEMADTQKLAFDRAIENSLTPDRLIDLHVDQDNDCQRILAALKKEGAATQNAREFYLVKQEAERALLDILAQHHSGEEQLQKVIQLTRHYSQRVRSFLPEAAWRALDKPRPCWMDVPGESE